MSLTVLRLLAWCGGEKLQGNQEGAIGVISCPYCQGEGKVIAEWGVGYHTTPSGVKVYVSSGATQPVWTEEQCPECNGAGELEDEEE